MVYLQLFTNLQLDKKDSSSSKFNNIVELRLTQIYAIGPSHSRTSKNLDANLLINH